MVVDVGPAFSYDLLRYLRHEGLLVDAVVLSHLDEDHAGALSVLLSSEIGIERVILPGGAEESISSTEVTAGLERLKEKGIAIEHMQAGDSVTAGEIQLIALSPDDSLQGSNERSLLLYALAGGKTLLLTGDLPKAAEPDILPDCDVLKVAHHGSTNATSDAFLSMAMPEIAIISVGKNNGYGHPHQRVLDSLETAKTQVLRTDLCGCVTIFLESEPMKIKTACRTPYAGTAASGRE